jgi:hypothetical protein
MPWSGFQPVSDAACKKARAKHWISFMFLINSAHLAEVLFHDDFKGKLGEG